MKLYTMVGLPASGKSTFAKTHPECVVISTDTIRKEFFGTEECQENGNKVFSTAYDRIEKALAEGKDVIFDATNLTKKSRKRVFTFKAEQIAVYMSTDKEECKKRNSQRERKVADFVIDRMAQKISVPSTEEGFEKVLVF